MLIAIRFNLRHLLLSLQQMRYICTDEAEAASESSVKQEKSSKNQQSLTRDAKKFRAITRSATSPHKSGNSDSHPRNSPVSLQGGSLDNVINNLKVPTPLLGRNSDISSDRTRSEQLRYSADNTVSCSNTPPSQSVQLSSRGVDQEEANAIDAKGLESKRRELRRERSHSRRIIAFPLSRLSNKTSSSWTLSNVEPVRISWLCIRLTEVLQRVSISPPVFGYGFNLCV